MVCVMENKPTKSRVPPSLVLIRSCMARVVYRVKRTRAIDLYETFARVSLAENDTCGHQLLLCDVEFNQGDFNDVLFE